MNKSRFGGVAGSGRSVTGGWLGLRGWVNRSSSVSTATSVVVDSRDWPMTAP